MNHTCHNMKYYHPSFTIIHSLLFHISLKKKQEEGEDEAHKEINQITSELFCELKLEMKIPISRQMARLNKRNPQQKLDTIFQITYTAEVSYPKCN